MTVTVQPRVVLETLDVELKNIILN